MRRETYADISTEEFKEEKRFDLDQQLTVGVAFGQNHYVGKHRYVGSLHSLPTIPHGTSTLETSSSINPPVIHKLHSTLSFSESSINAVSKRTRSNAFRSLASLQREAYRETRAVPATLFKYPSTVNLPPLKEQYEKISDPSRPATSVATLQLRPSSSVTGWPLSKNKRNSVDNYVRLWWEWANLNDMNAIKIDHILNELARVNVGANILPTLSSRKVYCSGFPSPIISKLKQWIPEYFHSSSIFSSPQLHLQHYFKLLESFFTTPSYSSSRVNIPSSSSSLSSSSPLSVLTTWIYSDMIFRLMFRFSIEAGDSHNEFFQTILTNIVTYIFDGSLSPNFILAANIEQEILIKRDRLKSLVYVSSSKSAKYNSKRLLVERLVKRVIARGEQTSKYFYWLVFRSQVRKQARRKQRSNILATSIKKYERTWCTNIIRSWRSIVILNKHKTLVLESTVLASASIELNSTFEALIFERENIQHYLDETLTKSHKVKLELQEVQQQQLQSTELLKLYEQSAEQQSLLNSFFVLLPLFTEQIEMVVSHSVSSNYQDLDTLHDPPILSNDSDIEEKSNRDKIVIKSRSEKLNIDHLQITQPKTVTTNDAKEFLQNWVQKQNKHHHIAPSRSASLPDILNDTHENTSLSRPISSVSMRDIKPNAFVNFLSSKSVSQLTKDITMKSYLKTLTVRQRKRPYESDGLSDEKYLQILESFVHSLNLQNHTVAAIIPVSVEPMTSHPLTRPSTASLAYLSRPSTANGMNHSRAQSSYSRHRSMGLSELRNTREESQLLEFNEMASKSMPLESALPSFSESTGIAEKLKIPPILQRRESLKKKPSLTIHITGHRNTMRSSPSISFKDEYTGSPASPPSPTSPVSNTGRHQMFHRTSILPHRRTTSFRSRSPILLNRAMTRDSLDWNTTSSANRNVDSFSETLPTALPSMMNEVVEVPITRASLVNLGLDEQPEETTIPPVPPFPEISLRFNHLYHARGTMVRPMIMKPLRAYPYVYQALERLTNPNHNTKLKSDETETSMNDELDYSGLLWLFTAFPALSSNCNDLYERFSKTSEYLSQYQTAGSVAHSSELLEIVRHVRTSRDFINERNRHLWDKDKSFQQQTRQCEFEITGLLRKRIYENDGMYMPELSLATEIAELAKKNQRDKTLSLDDALSPGFTSDSARTHHRKLSSNKSVDLTLASINKTGRENFTRMRSVLVALLQASQYTQITVEIDDSKPSSELNKCERVLGHHIMEIRKVYRHAIGTENMQRTASVSAGLIAGGTNSSLKSYSSSEIPVMSGYQFVRFTRQYKLPNDKCSSAEIDNLYAEKMSAKQQVYETIMNKLGAVDTLTFDDFVELLIRIASKRYEESVDLSSRIHQLFSVICSPTVKENIDNMIDFRLHVSLSGCHAVFDKYSQWLSSLFASYARNSATGQSFIALHGAHALSLLTEDEVTMSYEDWSAFVNDCDLAKLSSLTQEALNAIWANAQMDLDGEDFFGGDDAMVFTEFLESLCALSQFYDPSPFVSPESKLDILLMMLQTSPAIEARRHTHSVYTPSPMPPFSPKVK